MFIVRLLLNHRKKNHFWLYYCFWTISNWVSHDSLSSYRRLLINGIFSIYIQAILWLHAHEIVTIYTFKYAHQFTAIVLIKEALCLEFILDVAATNIAAPAVAVIYSLFVFFFLFLEVEKQFWFTKLVRSEKNIVFLSKWSINLLK